jgi:hypothetical protein
MTFAAEPPPSGPGPLVNLMHRGDGAADGNKLVGDYMNPILKPAAAEQVRRQGEVSKTGVPFPDPSNQCAPQSPPFILRQQQIELLQRPDQVTILYMLDHHVRHVRLNAKHPARVTPSWSGDSIGHYEGDTLVVDTIGVKVGPVSIIDQAGSPYSEALHVVERYRLIDHAAAKEAQERNVRLNGAPGTQQAAGIDPNDTGKGLQVQFTVEDTNVFNMPWSGMATYGRADGIWVENVCAENTHEYYNARDTAIPQADRPDF